MTRPDDSLLDLNQLDNVRRHVDRLLRDADAIGRFPTPIADIMAAAKLTVVDDSILDEGVLRRFMAKAKGGMATIKSALSKVFGLFEANDRLVVIDKNLPPIRVPFVKLHETGHGTLPHQREAYALMHDCEMTIDPDITDLFEREANVFASEALFQGETFAEQARNLAFGVKAPMALAKQFGASNYAAFRRYVITSARGCCVVVVEPIVRNPEGGFTAVVRRIVVSTSFHVMYDAPALFPEITTAHPLAIAIPRGRQRIVSPREIRLADRNGEARNCTAEAFNTTHQILVLISDKGPATKSTIVLPGSTAFDAIAGEL